MSYLTPPRLVFSGSFQADVSTVNNDPEHYDTGNFQPNYDLMQGSDSGTNLGHMDGWWNPKGTGAWRFFNCVVNSVTYRDGTVSNAASFTPDPLIGAQINATAERVEGKLVDLDPEQQMVSEIWGFRIMVGNPGSGSGVSGDFHTAGFSDLWTRFPGGQPDSFFGAVYQSVLENLRSANQSHSRFLTELLAADPKTLSVKFNVDGVDQEATSPTFTFGRVVGSIGLSSPEEPRHLVVGRQLLAAPGQTFGTAYAKLESATLHLDLGNTLPTASAGGPLAAQPSLFAALQVPVAPAFPQGFKSLAQLPEPSTAWYQNSAGIVSIVLSDADAALSKTVPLVVVNQQGTVLVTDAGPSPQTQSPGQFVRADQFVYRFNPGSATSGAQTIDFYATLFGEPAVGQQISLALDSSLMEGFVNQGTAISGPPVGVPITALTWPSGPITTAAGGKASVVVTSHDPGNPRGYIDGQVYGITYGLGSAPPATGSVTNPSQIVNPLVFSAYTIPEQPNWIEHVQPIFQQYANLYPVMKPIVDLGNFANVVGKLSILKRVFSAAETDPNYMPVTRDLSAPKRDMIRKWLDRPLYMNLDSVEDVMTALQIAIELEHSTIPPYLTALYSIKQGSNPEVADLIYGVVIEEMLHMHLLCNILVSIGGSPHIGRPGFVPTYPASLPGGLRSGLTIRLRRCSIERIRDCFVSIEEPSRTKAAVRGAVKPHDVIEPHKFTIGWFYEEILCALEQLGDQFTYGHVDKQVTTPSAPPIKSLADAQRAIREVILQGEGVNPENPDDSGRELAHFYKFSEIVAARRIVITKTGFTYTGDPIPFDPNGIWPMMDDPDLAVYPTGSRAQVLGIQFAQTYQSLLNSLHAAFNGSPDRIDDAFGLMFSLNLAASQLMETPSGLKEGTTAGPVFQLPVAGLAT